MKDFWFYYSIAFLGFAFYNEYLFVFKPAEIIETVARHEGNLPLNNLMSVKVISIIAIVLCMVGALFAREYKYFYIIYISLGLIHHAIGELYPHLDKAKWLYRVDGIICMILLSLFLYRLIYPTFHETASHQA